MKQRRNQVVKRRSGKRKAILLFSLIALFSFPFHYFAMTPIGSLRLALLRYGFPNYAQHLEEYDLQDPIYPFIVQKENQIGYSFGIPPYSQETGTKLQNWLITRYWIFYYSDWAGWC